MNDGGAEMIGVHRPRRRWLVALIAGGIAAVLIAGGSVFVLRGMAEDPESPQAEAPAAEQTQPTPAPAAPEQPPKPDHTWRTGDPADHGMNPEVFAQLHTALQGTQVRSVVTVRDGVIVDEFYNEGFDAASVYTLQSVSKSFTSALIGIALERGEIGSIDDPLTTYLPEVATLPDPRWQQITLRHLLNQTSGIDWPEFYGNIWETYSVAPNQVEFIYGRPFAADPGAVFEYSTGNTHLLSAVLERATGKHGGDYATEHLFEPLGIESVEWRTDPQGIMNGGYGIGMNARDAARFGQLYLQGGAWHDEQVVPAEWVAASTAVQSTGPGGGGTQYGNYGFQWWVRPFGAAGYDTYYAWGAFDEFIFVVPELHLVTVITAQLPLSASWSSTAYFTDYVLAAVTG